MLIFCDPHEVLKRNYSKSVPTLNLREKFNLNLFRAFKTDKFYCKPNFISSRKFATFKNFPEISTIDNDRSEGLEINKECIRSTGEIISLISDANNEEIKKDSISQYLSILNERAENGDIEAQSNLALNLSQDPELLEQSIYWQTKVAESGDPYEQYLLSMLCLEDEMIDKSFEPMDFDPPVQENNYYIDIDNLDSFLGVDIGVQPDFNGNKSFEFRKWLRNERKNFFSARKTNESRKCSEIENFELEKRKLGFEWLKRSYDNGCKAAGITLARYYLNPHSGITDIEKGIIILNKLATEDYILAWFKLGEYFFLLYQNKDPSSLTNTPEFIEFFEKAAELGDSNSQYLLGSFYHEGKWVKKDLVKSQDFLNRSVAQDNAAGLYYLSMLLRSNELGNYDSERVIEMLRRAAGPDHNNPDALFALGEIYYYGWENQDVNYQMALNYWKLAGKHGHSQALLNTGVMYYNGTGTSVDYLKAFYSYQNAAIYNNYIAMIYLSHMYKYGIGIPRCEEMEKYYKDLAIEEISGANNDDSFAIKRLIESLENQSECNKEQENHLEVIDKDFKDKE